MGGTLLLLSGWIVGCCCCCCLELGNNIWFELNNMLTVSFALRQSCHTAQASFIKITSDLFGNPRLPHAGL